MINADQIFAAQAGWASVIGNFIIKFGQLEYFVCVYIKDRLPTELDPALTKKTDLSKRLKWIRKDFVENNPTQLSAFDQWRDDLEPLRVLRNHIAHGYFLFTQVDNKPAICVCQVKDLDDESGRRLTLDELQTQTAVLSSLVQQIQDLTGWKS
jgi:hypothetical protein